MSDQDSVLQDAVYDSDVAAARAALAAGANVNSYTPGGSTPLLDAVTNDQPSEELVKLLIEAGADVNKKHKRYKTSALFSAARFGHPEYVPLLLDAGADVNEVDEDGLTPLAGAAMNQDREAITMLLKAGADTKVALEKAREFGDNDMAQFILSESANTRRGPLVKMRKALRGPSEEGGRRKTRRRRRRTTRRR